MTETAAQRELARQVARLEREAHATPADAHSLRCAVHGVQYACPAVAVRETYWPSPAPQGRVPACGHIACRAIVNGRCPECPEEET